MNALTLDDIRLFAEGAVAVHVSPPDLRAMQLARAAELWAAGHKVGAIAEAVGVPITTLRGWVNGRRDLFAFRRGDKAPPRESGVDPETLERAAALWAEGKTQIQIAAVSGVTRAIVCRWINDNRDRFPHRRRPLNAAPAETALPADLARAPQGLAEPKPKPAEFLPGIDTILTLTPHGPVTLLQLTDRACRWPLSGERASTLFCGCRILPGKIYCEPHRAKSRQGGG